MSKSALKVLILGQVWPEPESSAAGRRTWNLIDAFRLEAAALETQIVFASPCRDNEAARRLDRGGIETAAVQANDPAFDDWIATQAFDLVIFDRFPIEEQFGWRIRDRSPRTLHILDTIDLHFVRRARQVAIEAGGGVEQALAPSLDLETPDAYRELASILRADLTLVVSDWELSLLRNRFAVPAEKLLLLPVLYPEADQLELALTPAFSAREHFASIGNFRHAPNADATRWLRREIWPQVRARLPRAEMHMFGAYPSQEMLQLSAAREGFFVRGVTEHSIETLKKYRVNLAPLRFGAGIKGKIADGWLAGTPPVTTPIGAEGMELRPGVFGGRMATDPGQLAREALRLYSDERSWQEAREVGAQTLRSRLGFAGPARTFARSVAELVAQQNERPGPDFASRMLAWHSYRSSRYFSKWIEMKNKLQSGVTAGQLRPAPQLPSGFEIAGRISIDKLSAGPATELAGERNE